MAEKTKMSIIDWLVWILVVLGSISWGVFGVTQINLFSIAFAGIPELIQISQILIGLSGLYLVWSMFGKKRNAD